jgi:GH25 family lysozyme M1 (1,4-beta-N-acetylmuramidase)
MAYQGIDISQHNGNVDMKKVKAAKDFVIIRSGYGNITAWPNQVDTKFSQNVKNAKTAGLNFGVYFYSYATDEAGMKTEANAFVKQLAAIKPIPYIVALDIEEQSQYKLSSSKLESIIKTFMDIVEKAGYYIALYSYNAFLSKLSSSFRSKYCIWCANTSGTPTIPCGIHQYSFNGTVSGITGRVDLDKTEIDYNAIIKNAGLNGYTAPKVLDTKGMKQGDKNLGVYELKSLLSLAEAKKIISTHITVDDGFGSGTTKVVNDLLDKWGYKPNGIAGEGFVKKLTDLLR